MRRVTWVLGTVVAALFASGPGCKGTIIGGPGGSGGKGGAPVSTIYSSWGDASGTWTSTTSWADAADGWAGITCYDCACVYYSGDSPPGCADTCDNTVSGASAPNFCNGYPALSQCEACIQNRCGATSATCN